MENSIKSTAYITNIVATFSLGKHTFFSPQRYKWIAENCIDTEFRPSKFHSIVMRWRPSYNKAKEVGTITATIFRNGKIVLCGSRSIETAKKFALRVCRRVQFALDQGAQRANRVEMSKRYPRLHVYRFKVRNVVGTMTMPFRINLEQLFRDWSKRSTSPFVNPRLDFSVFPAFRSSFVLNRPSSPSNSSPTSKNSVLIFNSGKIIMTGAKTTDDIHLISIFLFNLLVDYSR